MEAVDSVEIMVVEDVVAVVEEVVGAVEAVAVGEAEAAVVAAEDRKHSSSHVAFSQEDKIAVTVISATSRMQSSCTP